MVASVFIIGLSVVLFIYWFRYSCLLLLRDSSNPVGAAETDLNSRFGFREVQRDLPGARDLDPLHRALERDYMMLAFLIDHASGLGLGSLEDRLLVLDYKLMRLWYRLTRSLFPSGSRRALSEMALVLQALVRRVGAQSDAYSRA